ncbi:DUF3037 domain-containing protein [Lactiplantibacillus plantarum]|uniref:DUF3037 domain-containing protein n=1 Tax=Lactiplantibacillus plantarum TaxID=1590 RepID=UPI0008635973|nr:DUF3037 domain-containing protein [Lactiplantibacillus plantarum]MCG0808195.1 hypothetical protein [Lactiplantibacillus plantarum]OEZ35995.1 hypothetical protein A6B36_03350 [Lactiplantibacillus plantarum]WBB04814.1 DUF3037 domain-containing protein [Lactiplantibacillus plantarum]
MADRHSIWYAIITYVPDQMRYERMNVGVIIGDKYSQQITFKLLPSTNRKFSNFFWSSLERKEYQVSIEYLEFLLKNIQNEMSIFDVPKYNNADWNTWLGAKLPNGIIISTPHTARTSNDLNVFNNLIQTYIGDQFLTKAEKALSLKTSISSLFTTYKHLENKLKRNVKVQPAANLPLKFEIDYAYQMFNSKNPSFIQITPNETSINDWYKNTFTLLNKNRDNFHLNIVTKESDYQSSKSALRPLLNDIISDERVSPILVSNEKDMHEMTGILNQVTNSRDIKDWSIKQPYIA